LVQAVPCSSAEADEPSRQASHDHAPIVEVDGAAVPSDPETGRDLVVSMGRIAGSGRDVRHLGIVVEW
jgi:hypothetical protein